MGFIDKFKDIVNPKDIDEGYEDDEYVFDDGGNNTEYTNYDTDYRSQTSYTQRRPAPQQYGVYGRRRFSGGS